MNKYRLTDETIRVLGHKLHRIQCVKEFGNVDVGDKGGYIESENNLSQDGNAWVYDRAEVSGNARVYGSARVYDNARVSGNARVYGSAEVSDNAEVYGDAEIYGNAKIYDDAVVCSNADYIVFKNNWSSGRYFTWTRSNDRWSVGCFYGTGEELIKKAYADSENSGKHYEAYVRFVEQLKQLEK